ncbi:MAG TPA: glycosyltransferase family 4 protein [Polyangiaceae bacterium]|nr:glycosyltransferase family 4 protein [Polyangiaceae bacterium]
MKLIFGFKSAQLAGNADWEYAETQPLGGSETALLRMAVTFRDLGHEVEVINYPPSIPEYQALLGSKQCDVFVNSRRPDALLLLQRLPGRVNYYWAHDDADQPLLTALVDNERWRKAFYRRLTGLFLLSYYQRAAWLSKLSLPLEKSHLITNPIPSERFTPDLSRLRARAPRAYFASTPYRGLSQLLQGWPLVRRRVPNAEVHVYSSLAVNGEPETEQSLQLYERARRTPGVVFHGAVSQKELREAAAQARVLAYPCVFPETSCIAAMEAMASGAVVVATELGALPETAWRNPLQPLTEGWLERWAEDVVRVFLDDDHYEDLALQNVHISRCYDARVVARRMGRVFDADLARSALDAAGKG